jgi:hypothetical protein
MHPDYSDLYHHQKLLLGLFPVRIRQKRILCLPDNPALYVCITAEEARSSSMVKIPLRVFFQSGYYHVCRPPRMMKWIYALIIVDTSFRRHALTLHTESDPIQTVNNKAIAPYSLGVPPVIVRRDAQGRLYTMLLSQVQQVITLQNGVIQQQQKMQPPIAAPPMSISSRGGMRPPSVPVTRQLT